MANRVKYSKDQLRQYYDRLGILETKRHYFVTSLTSDEQLELLEEIIKQHVIRIPFENLVLHYSWHRVINTHAIHLFRKIIQQPGRGGYCMEVNSLLHTFLLSLGFKCYTAPGRVRVGDAWTSFSHLVNVVTVGETRHLCDVGFGNNEPLRPIKMVHLETVDQIRPTQTRLVFESIPEHLSDHKMWILQSRIDQDAEWQSMYCFAELEVMPADIVSLNYAPWKGTTSTFVRNVICVRYTTGADPKYARLDQGHDDSIEIDGVLIINNDQLKWRRNGKVILQKTFQKEEERVEALEAYWGIKLDQLDIEAIFGSVTAIVAKDK